MAILTLQEQQDIKAAKEHLQNAALSANEILQISIHMPDAFDNYEEGMKNCLEHGKEAIFQASQFLYKSYGKPATKAALKKEVTHFVKKGQEEAVDLLIDKVYDLPITDLNYSVANLKRFISFQRARNAYNKIADDFLKAYKNQDETALLKIPSNLAEYMKVPVSRQGVLTCLDDVVEQHVEWLWNPYIPLGKITMLEGDPSCGKTFLSLALCKQVTNGEKMNGQSVPPENVLYLTAEDGMADTIKPRFVGLGGNPKFFYGGAELPDGSLMSMSDTDVLESMIREKLPKLIVIDPLSAFLGSKVDMHRANEVRPVMAGLGRLAEKYNLAVIVIRHLNKGTGKASYRGQGSIDFTALARSVLAVGADPNNPELRAFIQTKCSLAMKGCAQGFKIITNSFNQPELIFTGDSELTVDDLLAEPAETTKADDAVHFLETVLKDGPLAPKEIKKQAKDAGLGENTLQSAKRKLGIRVSCVDKKKGEWVWRLS
ncbi:AAA family ATPase [Telmatobacter sp. DSM 110680]|uniref:AAA family ATPase n=1 Tax=Telmatobacter sp. DSM 110680 TaxID=3036704 RepID=A0AAU7DLI2_9BACT